MGDSMTPMNTAGDLVQHANALLASLGAQMQQQPVIGGQYLHLTPDNTVLLTAIKTLQESLLWQLGTSGPIQFTMGALRDVLQFRPGVSQFTVGHVTDFSIAGIAADRVGDTTLRADMPVVDPLADPNARDSMVQVIGVMKNYSWGGGPMDPMQLVFYVSAANRGALTAMVQRELGTRQVSLEFKVFAFDQAYFLAMKPVQYSLEAFFVSDGTGAVSLAVGDAFPVQVYSYYPVTVSLKPQPIQQRVLWSSGVNKTFEGKWGS